MLIRVTVVALFVCYTSSMVDKLTPEILRQHKGVSFAGITTCFFCTDGQGKLFLAKRSNKARDEHGNWDVGGGGLKFGIRAIDNAIREIQEEYSATPTNIEFIGYRDILRNLPDGTPTHWVALDFKAVVDPKDVKINEPDMFDDSGWFKLDDLPAPLHSQVAFGIDKYKQILS